MTAAPVFTLAAVVARAVREIVADAYAGKVPRTVRSFSELHGYVDANEYGGLHEEALWLHFNGDAAKVVAFANDVQGSVDRWLSNEGLTKWH